MAKEKKHLPGIDEVDATDATSLGGAYIPNKGTPDRSRRVIPGRVEIKNNLEGVGIITQHAPQIAGTLHHINNPLLNRTSTMPCQHNGGHNVGGAGAGCEMPATDIVRNTSRPRSSAIAVCKTHLGKVTQEAINNGEDLEISKAHLKNIQDLKKVQSQEAEKSSLKVAGGLLLDGSVPYDDALLFNMGKKPGGQKVHKFGGEPEQPTATPMMNDEEAAAYHAERIKAKAGKEPTEYQLSSKPIEVKMGNKTPRQAEPPLGEGTGDIDHVLRLYRANDSSWSSEATRLGIHESQLQPQNVSGPKVGLRDSDKLLFTGAPERMTKALTNVGEDQQEDVIDAYSQNDQADKQRRIQARRAGLPGTRPGLPMRRGTELPNPPKKLEGRRDSFEQGQNKEIEPPK